MKKLVEETNEGFEKLIGERVMLICCRYIYAGKLIGVNDDCVLLTDCGIVYETGAWDKKDWTDYQKLPSDTYVMKGSIESYGVSK